LHEQQREARLTHSSASLIRPVKGMPTYYQSFSLCPRWQRAAAPLPDDGFI
jgi:hypothetical protein